MSRFRSRLPLAFAFLPLATCLWQGCAETRVVNVDNWNAWKETCYELSVKYQEKLKILPYHPFAARGSDRCSSPDPQFTWDVDAKNYHIIVANFFYHDDLKVRRRAFEMLENWHCDRDGKCGDLAELLDAHIRASLPIQSEAWKKEFHARLRDFWRHVLDIDTE
ncbi:MAG: hypothetical protein HY075_02090 [Deltaproteobacteria bacterium]|nr:hypothetical protein [Deltaproteobacteria bacterium]